MSSYDRFAPESYEDYICRGKTVQQIAQWLHEQRIAEQRRLEEQQRLQDDLEDDMRTESYRFSEQSKPTNFHE